MGRRDLATVVVVAALAVASAAWWARRGGRREVAVGHAPFLDRLVPTLVAGIARRDTDRPVFHGDVDWHSAVHGHWAILRVARVTDAHADAARAVDRSLDPEGLAAEARLLEADPVFEMPYGRAWFLLLASEHERWSRATGGADPRRLRPMAQAQARALRRHLEATLLDPGVPEYANPCWALARLHAWYAFTQDGEGVAWARRRVEERLRDPAPPPSFARDARAPEFFSLFGNWALLVARTTDAATVARFLERHPIAPQDLAPIRPTPGAAHPLGMNWSRAWALAALARRAPTPAEAARLRAAYDAHVAAGLRDHAAHAGDVWAYDHWVPQFAVYALTQDDDDAITPREGPR